MEKWLFRELASQTQFRNNTYSESTECGARPRMIVIIRIKAENLLFFTHSIILMKDLACVQLIASNFVLLPELYTE